jgi:hypothetical protein
MKLLVVEACPGMFLFTRTVPDVIFGVALFLSRACSVKAKGGAG